MPFEPTQEEIEMHLDLVISSLKEAREEDGFNRLELTAEQLDQIYGAKNLHLSDYRLARESGATHDEVMDAHSWNKGAGPRSPVNTWTYNPQTGKHRPSVYMWDTHIHSYASTRFVGATHNEAKDAYSQGILDLSQYAKARHSKDGNLSHEQAIELLKPKGVTFQESSNATGIEPTPEEYDEAKSLDVDPDTFDKATYKRLRNAGAPHVDIIDAGNRGIPIEDYETAYKNNGNDHLKSIDEALRYQDGYRENMANNSTIIAHNQGQMDANKKVIDSHESDFNDLVNDLFGHHMALKAKPSFDNKDGYVDTPWRRRSNEWIMNECAKLDPSLKPHVGKSVYNESAILSPDAYNSKVDNLMTKNQYGTLYANTIKDYVAHKRKANALNNIGDSQFIPHRYTHDSYEEE